ncbi:MAG: endopeptidase La [Oscillospiraceae bacterium]|nr:endopeptidase La [Oscillospiraceae bacterium]
MLLPIIALRGLTVFPEMYIHFDLGRQKSGLALDEAMRGNQMVFLVAQRDVRTDDPDLHELFSVGAVSQIRQILRLPSDNARVLAEGRHRAILKTLVKSEPYPAAEVEILRDKPGRIPRVRQDALLRAIRGLLEEYISLQPRVSPEILLKTEELGDPGHIADYIAQNIPIRHSEKQEILELSSPYRRLERLYVILTSENDVLSTENEIRSKLQDRLNKNQREYYLKEQIKTIQQELGEDEDMESESEQYIEKIGKLQLSPETSVKLIKEARRLARLSSSSPETALARTYLDTCLEMPWNKYTKDRLDIPAVERVLNADHFGLTKIKERILEFLSVKRLAPDVKGQILCLVGPPGVGKTSVALSIARAAKRKYARLSLGGIRDEADIRGHRKTYIGAMPGRIVNALRQAGSKNALILLDEIDKLGSDSRGDPASALLEVLDPEQNSSFRDHYLEVPFDLSDVLFITTANTTETIPRPLLDRMEVLELTSYTDSEKLEIAKRHLIPKQLKKHGLTRANLTFAPGGLREIISGYTRESGVRVLERKIAAVCRKTAKRIAEGETAKASITAGTASGFLGVRKYKPESSRPGNEVGVANGLAWTCVGGELLEVEVGIMEGSGKIDLTGNLGDVMKESSKAALTYIRERSESLGIEKDFYKTKDMHIHFPEGATPKDGPSAGITMALAMASALSGRPVRQDIAMTGEITLRGRVLPIGGLKEKTMAAFRAGIKTVIIPEGNEKDLPDIDPSVKNSLSFVLAGHMDKVLETGFCTAD